MHRPAAMSSMLVLIICFFLPLFLPLHAQHQTKPAAAGGNTATASASCLPHERDALLAFKHGVTSDPAGLLDSWRRDGGHREQDCCRWTGVRCSNRTGRVQELRLGSTSLVGQISPSLLALQHLEHLNLSHNDLVGPSGRIPEFMGSLKSLRYLDLAAIQFSGEVPPQLGNLSKLQYLDLSSTGDTNSTDLSWLTRLPSIQHLSLNNVNLSTVMDWPHVMNMIPSLKALHLSRCSLASANQSLPRLNLTNLEELDASGNSFDHPLSASWFWNITSLTYLDLSLNRLYGQIPDKLTSLQVLDLSFNGDGDRNMGVMTTDLKNLCSLEVLKIRWAFLYGDITEMFKNLSDHCSLNKLKELDLCFNQLTGTLPKWIGQLTSLVNLELCWNNITGPLPASFGRLTDLKLLDLSYNHLTGNVPHEIGVLTNLIQLYLNNNGLDGVVTKEHFANARSLQEIDLSYNALNIVLSSEWQPPSKLSIAHFASCQMGPLFPGWLQWQVRLTDLDISSAGIVDKLPQWFSDAFSNVQRLNISNNQLIGGLPASLSSMSLFELYLSSSQLTGQIPTLPPNIDILDLSNNSLSGPLPSGSGAMGLGPIELSLFSNKLSGQIPEYFCKYQGLAVLDLSNNFLEGELPSCLGVMEDMEFIALSNNNFSGEFPSFLENFTSVLFLDLARNKFTGTLPVWIGNLVSLRILCLSHNKFFGNIPMNITNLACLQYMDLSSNEISGSLPSYLSNLKAMRKTNMTGMCYVDDIANFHLISLSTVLKAQEQNYGSISRVFDTNMMSIDLSSNNLTGEIPEEIVALNVLVNLNLSRNHFIGVVPNKIGDMQSLESLDLSRNNISGEIPATMSNLTFLSYLDLSYNNLTGRIPSGTQLDSLYAANPLMYIGNIGLCGHPLQNNCSREGDASSKQGHQGRTKEGAGMQFFYLGLGCGFAVGTCMAFGVLLFKRRWRITLFQLSDKLYDKVYVLIATRATKTLTDKP